MVDIVDELWEHAYLAYDEGALDCLTGRAAAEIDTLRAENERLRDHMEEINAIVGECEYDKKTRKTVDRLRTIAKEALK